MDLSGHEGAFAVEWHHPETREMKAAEPTMGGDRRTLGSPFEGDSVLFIIKQ